MDDEQDPIGELAQAREAARDAGTEPGAAPSGRGGDEAVCVHHAETAAKWRCPACAAHFCDACVRIYAAREVRLAACVRCGGMCKSLTEPTPEQRGIRAGAVEDEETVRRRLLRDRKIPLAVLSTAAFLLLLLLGGRGLAGLGLWLATLMVGTGAAAAGYWVAGLVAGLDFEPVGPTLLKLAAIGAAVHAARLGCWGMFGVTPPSSGLEALALLGPLSVTFVIAPVTVLIAAVMGLSQLDTFEKVVTVVALFLVDAFAMFVLVSLGLFG